LQAAEGGVKRVFMTATGKFDRPKPIENRRLRSILYAALAVLAIWLVAMAGYMIARNSKMTAGKIREYVNSVDLSRLSAAERARAIQALADRINALSPEERRRWRLETGWREWFAEMTEAERGQFIEATLPTGFKQMMNAFADMPEARRKRFIDEALKDLRAQPDNARRGPADYGTNGPPPISPELEQKVRVIGLKVFYGDSSAQTKAELAPLIEELQNQLRSGRGFR
jgi:hypothetical protein